MTNHHLSSNALGQNILSFRKAKKYSRETFAELTGVSSRMVYDWENGVSKPSLDRIVVIAVVLEVTLDSMFTVR